MLRPHLLYQSIRSITHSARIDFSLLHLLATSASPNIERSKTMMSRTFLAGAAAIAVIASTHAFGAESSSPLSGKQEIAFAADTAYPESLSWSKAHQRFFVSSVRHGTVGAVSPDGQYKPFITDNKLVSTVGLLADDAHDTLWVTNSDPGAGERTDASSQGKLAGIATYNMTTGKRSAYHDLGSLSKGAHFANDVTLDAEGNAYVTDSFAPIIYRIDTAGKATIFAQNPLFKNGDGFNLNGIAYHRDGYLLVGKYNTGELFRVSLADPGDIHPVKLAEPLKGADGFNLVDSQHLVVAINAGGDKTVELVSEDGWKTARIAREVKSAASMPTAATQAGGDIWVLNSRLDTLFDPKAKKVSDFILQKF
jgi:sugar lactone lactonase YvrE